MLEYLVSSWVFYAVAAVVIGSLLYGVWSGLQKSNEAVRRVYGRLDELLETKPEHYVVNSLAKPDSSKVG